jgi:hypothetical protein
MNKASLTVVKFALLSFACIAAGISVTGEAEAQCINASLSRGKVRLVKTKPNVFGQCRAGGVLVEGSAGAVGAPGATGPQGPQGPEGPQGAYGGGTIPSGQTVRGFIGQSFYTESPQRVEVYGSIPGGSATPLEWGKIIIKENAEVLDQCGRNCLSSKHVLGQRFCPGDVNNPTAAPGYLCIYPIALTNSIKEESLDADIIRNDFDQLTGLGGGLGFSFGFQQTRGSSFGDELLAVWAYTAP